MATITESQEPRSRSATGPPEIVERYGRRARWFHTFVYTTVLITLATGWWLLTGHEGDPSPLARVSGTSDASLHKVVGGAFAAGSVVFILLGFRAARTFAAESLRVDRGDGRWFTRWPRAVLTGRFGRHEGHFDPGQRAANVAIVVVLAALVVSGSGLVAVHGGPAFVWLARVHKWSTYAAIPVILGHILIASGLLPGYRGVWRSMHLGGRLPARVAERLWPAWLERRGPRR
jgi:cytochrome b subunit of formate dehydrogenase